MSEGGFTPEQPTPKEKPQSPTEKSNSYMKKWVDRILLNSTYSIGLGVLGTEAFDRFVNGDMKSALTLGALGAVSTVLAARGAAQTIQEVSRLNQENTKLKEGK